MTLSFQFLNDIKPIRIYKVRKMLSFPPPEEFYSKEDYIILWDEYLWFGPKNQFRGGLEQFIEKVKYAQKLTKFDTIFVGESNLNFKKRKMEFQPLNPTFIPAYNLEIYLARAFYFNEGWYDIFCNCLIFYEGKLQGTLKDIIKSYEN